MRFPLKLVVLLFCVQRGDGRGLRSLLEQRSDAGSPEEESRSGETREDDNPEPQRRGSVAGEPWSLLPLASIQTPGLLSRPRRGASTHCGLRTLLLQVRDLGLGYDSDETVLFKYCSGSCPHARSNHDLTLTSLLLQGALPPPPMGELWHSTPCCRPTHHEDLAFLDNRHRWHKVEKLLAADCSCVG
ncbi:persephin [Osmerus eperlanus]|uniref:persephin n=1 Tax=Osmerus eperlanus TaxID=29151 RepID=UPI002E1381C1